MSLKILHTADLHLGNEYKFVGEKSAQLIDESFKSFEKLINYCVNPNNEIDILLIAGDLFDTHKPETRIVERVKEQLQRVVKKGIKLFLLPGNHDSYGYKNSIYKTEEFPGIVIKNTDFDYVTDLELKGGRVFIYGGVFEPGKGTKRMLSEFRIWDENGIHIGLLHGTLEMKNIEVPSRDLPFSYEEFANTGLNYLALGHFHSFFTIEIDAKHKAAYSGSLLPCKINEYGDKYALLVEIPISGKIKIEKLQFSHIVADYKEIDLTKENVSSFNELIEKIKTFSAKNKILTLALKGIADFPVPEDELIARIENNFCYVRIQNNIKFIDSSIINQLKDEETVRGLYFKKLIERYHQTENAQKRGIIENAINFGLQEFVE